MPRVPHLAKLDGNGQGPKSKVKDKVKAPEKTPTQRASTRVLIGQGLNSSGQTIRPTPWTETVRAA